MTTTVQAGNLRHRITLRQKASTTTANAYGERTPTYQDVATVWARVRPLNARENERAKSAGQSISHAIDIRYREGLDVGMQIVHRGRTLLLNGITDTDEDKVKMTLYCTELPAGV